MLKKDLSILLGIFLGGAALVAVLIIAKPTPAPEVAAEEPANVKVEVVEARPQSVRLSVITQGTVTPKREIDLVAQVSGKVVSVEPNFEDGGFFSTAQALIQIDDSDYRSALLSAKARVADAEYRLAEEQGMGRQAAREWRDLGNKNANDLFMRKPQLAAAQANLASAKGQLETAGMNLQRTRITVPFDGRVKQTFVDLGQYVSVGSRLATVYDSTVVEVRLPLTEKQAALVDLPLLPKEQRDGARLPKVVIRGSVAGAEHEWHGVLARTDAFVDANSRLYYGVVEVENPFASRLEGDRIQAPLLPGLFVEAEIEGKQLANVIELPRSALYQRSKLLLVDSENAIAEQHVEVLQRSETHVWVRADVADKALVSLEKQSLTPVGTVVDPLISVNEGATPVAMEVRSPSSPTTIPEESTEE